MSSLLAGLKSISDFMTEQRWQFCLIGGLAVVHWGEARFTRDVDIALMTGYNTEEDYAKTLLHHFESRIPNALEFALQNRVVLLLAPDKTPIDISFAALPFEQEMMERAVAYEFAPSVAAPVCSAEDLLVMKLFSSRPKDLADATSIAIRQRGKLDSAYILRHLGQLSEIMDNPHMLSKAIKLLEDSK